MPVDLFFFIIYLLTCNMHYKLCDLLMLSQKIADSEEEEEGGAEVKKRKIKVSLFIVSEQV